VDLVDLERKIETYIIKMSKELFVPENREIVENLKIGQIFSANDLPVLFTYNNGNNNTSSSAQYIVYLGADTRTSVPVDSVLCLVVLKNGQTLRWTMNKPDIEKYLDKGWISKSKRTKTMPSELLDEIQKYYPDREHAIEITKIVGNELNFGNIENTPIHLPNNVKNNLASFLAYFPKDKNQFPEDYINKKDDDQNAGRRNKRSIKTRKPRKPRKTRKTRKTTKSRKYR
jgi:hypothetical protein